MHVAHGTYKGSVAGSRRTLARRGSSGNLSVEGDDEPSPGGAVGGSSPGSVGGGSSVQRESFIRRAQHAVNVHIGLLLAMHTDFFARRGLLTRQLVSILESVVVVAALTIIGTVIFSKLERSQDQILEARYSAIMAEVSSKVSPETYAELGFYIQNPRQGDVWALSSQGAYLFAFSTVTSIGYGVFTPVTEGGQLFFCFYALLCIPICGISFGRVATSVVDLLSWFQACYRGKIRKSFKAADTESRGYITQDEMRAAIERALRSTADVTELEELVEEIDPNDTNRITLKMYAWAFSQLGSLDERALQKTHRVRLAIFCYVVWNITGMIIFHLSEGWSWIESIYFCFETLMTIGLGDYVPKSTNGVQFQFIFCILGLGMLASVVTAIVELDAAEEAVARAAVESLARDKLRRISETHSRGSAEPSTPVARLSASDSKPDEIVERVTEIAPQGHSDMDSSDTEEPDEPPAPVAPAPVAAAQPMERQVPLSARFSAGEAQPWVRTSAGAPPPPTRHSASGPLPLPSPPADIRLRPTPPNSPPWFVPQAPGDPPPMRLHTQSNGLVTQAFIARGAEERARARAERAARVAARREALTGQVEEDALHVNAAQQQRRMLSPADWSDA